MVLDESGLISPAVANGTGAGYGSNLTGSSWGSASGAGETGAGYPDQYPYQPAAYPPFNPYDYGEGYAPAPVVAFPHIHPAAKALLCLSYALMMAVCGVGNLLLCYVIYRFRRMRTTTNLLIGNLALSDFLVAVVCAPLSFYQHLHQHWPFGTAMCVLTNYLKFTSLYVSTNSLLAIAIDRYVIIMHPLKPRMTKCTAGAVLVCIWLVSMAVVVPTAVVSTVHGMADEWGRPALRCGEYWRNFSLMRAHTLFLALAGFLLPLAIMSVVYVLIAKKLWLREVPGGHVTAQQELAAESSKRKTLRMLILVVALFALCWAPFQAFAVARDFAVADAGRSPALYGTLENAYYVVEALAMSNSMFNTLIYIVFNANFRKYVRQIPDSCRTGRRGGPRSGPYRSSGVGAGGVGGGGPGGGAGSGSQGSKSGRRYWYPLVSSSHVLRSSLRSSLARTHSTNISRLAVRREQSAPSSITPSGRSG